LQLFLVLLSVGGYNRNLTAKFLAEIFPKSLLAVATSLNSDVSFNSEKTLQY